MRSVPSDLLGSPISARIGAQMQRSVIRSIQTGTIAIGTGATSNTATITAVDTANSILVWGGWSSGAPAVALAELSMLLALTNATTVTASHNTAGNDIVAAYTVVEYWPGVIRSVQRGAITITNGNLTNTATLSPAVVVTKSQLEYLGYSFTATATQDGVCHLVLTNTTTVTATRGSSTANATIGWQVVEWW